MKSAIRCAGIALLLTIPALLQAQGEAGTWKMDTEKSKFSGIDGPKSLTATVEEQNGGVKRHGQGVAADGSPIDYSYTAKYDGQDNLITGSGAPSGADSIALNRINARTTEATWKEAGKVVNTSRYSLSSDGKVLTINAKGTAPDGKPTTAHVVFEKQ
jgi:hypothetical protein